MAPATGLNEELTVAALMTVFGPVEHEHAGVGEGGGAHAAPPSASIAWSQMLRSWFQLARRRATNLRSFNGSSFGQAGRAGPTRLPLLPAYFASTPACLQAETMSM